MTEAVVSQRTRHDKLYLEPFGVAAAPTGPDHEPVGKRLGPTELSTAT